MHRGGDTQKRPVSKIVRLQGRFHSNHLNRGAGREVPPTRPTQFLRFFYSYGNNVTTQRHNTDV